MSDEMLKLLQKIEAQKYEIRELQKTQERLIRYVDYLGSFVDKNISYSEYVAENLDNLMSHFPEAIPRKDFRDLFNA